LTTHVVIAAVVAEMEWWWLLVAFVGGVIAFLPLVILLFTAGGAVGKAWSWRKRRRGRGEPSLAFAYYVDEPGLRSLAEGLKIQLPVSRNVTHTGTLSARVRGVTGAKERKESAEFAGIDLNRVAEEIQRQAADGAVAASLGRAPRVQDEQVLAATIERLKNSAGETSPTRELLEALQKAYEGERGENVAAQKRSELERVAERGQMVMLTGRFAPKKAGDPGPVGSLGLLALDDVQEPTPQELLEMGPFADYYDFRHAEYQLSRRIELPMPDGVAIEVALPDRDSLTPSGSEVVRRSAAFHARVIAHTPSYSPADGTLTCIAYAVWGVPKS
jgi:hypothetical protein